MRREKDLFTAIGKKRFFQKRNSFTLAPHHVYIRLIKQEYA